MPRWPVGLARSWLDLQEKGVRHECLVCPWPLVAWSFLLPLLVGRRSCCSPGPFLPSFLPLMASVMVVVCRLLGALRPPPAGGCGGGRTWLWPPIPVFLGAPPVHLRSTHGTCCSLRRPGRCLLRRVQRRPQNPEPALDLRGQTCLLYTSPSPRDRQKSRMPSSA